GAAAVDLTCLARSRFELAYLGVPRFDRIELCPQPSHRRGQVVGLTTVLAGQGAQLEKPRLDPVEFGWIERERFGRLLQLLLGLSRLDHRPVQRMESLAEQRVLLSDPIEPAGRAAQ